jgi:hypothetical protein
MEGQSPMQAFYRDKVVFITGGTGFIGKVLLEKLLRCLRLLLLVSPLFSSPSPKLSFNVSPSGTTW